MADFFRYNVKKGEEDATLEEELEAVDNYIYILNVRFAGDIHFSKKVECDVENVRVPSMILQPVVENAVRHGVLRREEGGTVTIRTEETADAYLVTVSDDGLGFPDKLEGEDNQSHIGIKNVRERLRLLCGGTLTLRSTPGRGTAAAITIPKEGATL